MGVINNGKVKINYETSGTAETGSVILIRGQGSQLIHWPESFYSAFSDQGFLTVRFDNRDTGLSSKFDQVSGPELESLKQKILAGKQIEPPYTLEDMVLDVLALMDGLGIDSAHIVGMSMGGFIAQLLAAKHPARVNSMTSIMSASGAVDPAILDNLWLYPRSREEYIQDWVEYTRLYGSKKYFQGDDHSRSIAAQAFDRCYSPDGANRQLLAILTRQDTRDLVSSIKAPTLVVHGQGDLLIPPERGRQTAELIPNAEFRLIQGMGHDIPPNLGRELAEIILRHITSTTPRIS